MKHGPVQINCEHIHICISHSIQHQSQHQPRGGMCPNPWILLFISVVLPCVSQSYVATWVLDLQLGLLRLYYTVLLPGMSLSFESWYPCRSLSRPNSSSRSPSPGWGGVGGTVIDWAVTFHSFKENNEGKMWDKYCNFNAITREKNVNIKNVEKLQFRQRSKIFIN